MKILLLEDEKDLAQTGKEQLELMGHEVFAAFDIASARESLAAEGRRMGLVIADQRLPDGMGIDLVVELREQFPDTQFVIVSGVLTSADTAFLKEHDIPYFHKPLLYSKILRDLHKRILDLRLAKRKEPEPEAPKEASREASMPEEPRREPEVEPEPEVETLADIEVPPPLPEVPLPARTGSAGPVLNILLIEDEEDLARSAKDQLEALGHKVLLAGTIAEARDRLEKESGQVQLVIADHALPDGYGIDFVGEMKSWFPDARFIVVSGALGEGDIARLEIYNIPYFEKPVAYGKVIEGYAAELGQEESGREERVVEPDSSTPAEEAPAESKVPFWKRIFGGKD